VPGADAQAGAERERREAVRQQRSAAAAELDGLTANDAELEQAVAELNSVVAAQEARVADARRATEEARTEAARLQDEVDATIAEVNELEILVRERAVEAYIGNGAGRSRAEDALLDASDPTELELRRVLLETVHGTDRSTIDQLGLARQTLERQQEGVAAALAEAEELEAEVAARLTELEEARAEQQRLRDALSARISGYRAEVAALAAEEDSLTAIIAEADAAAARAAAEAAARQASSGGGGGGGPIDSNAPRNVERPASASGLIWPTTGPVTAGYGMRWGAMHQGIDIAPPHGTPVYAVKDGRVIFAGTQGGYGTMILIDHGQGFVTAYAHLSGIVASSGSVAQGQLIGYVGNTGNSTGPHLHFETRVNGSAQNPMSYLP
jgi:murein DD-endopeptidase MepM/ murein hydrolase activator NlpD